MFSSHLSGQSLIGLKLDWEYTTGNDEANSYFQINPSYHIPFKEKFELSTELAFAYSIDKLDRGIYKEETTQLGIGCGFGVYYQFYKNDIFKSRNKNKLPNIILEKNRL